jgi:hypothetical protein
MMLVSVTAAWASTCVHGRVIGHRTTNECCLTTTCKETTTHTTMNLRGMGCVIRIDIAQRQLHIDKLSVSKNSTYV